MMRSANPARTETVARDRWLVSYTDIVTILLILFVAIAAQSVNARLTPEPRTADQPDPRQRLRSIGEMLQKRGLEVRLEPRGLVISLPQAILFPSGEDQVSEEAFPTINGIAEVLRGIPNKIALVGHADAVPIHNSRFKNNWELSAARSLSLLSLLATEYGIDEPRLSVQSYGAYSPKGSNDTEEGRAQNRRVEIIILDQTSQ